MTLLGDFAHLASTDQWLFDIHCILPSHMTLDLEHGDTCPGGIARWSSAGAIVCLLCAAAIGVMDHGHAHIIQSRGWKQCITR